MCGEHSLTKQKLKQKQKQKKDGGAGAPFAVVDYSITVPKLSPPSG
jgi:hypothetical protein